MGSDDFAMPQPLNRVVPKATYQANPNALDDKPELAVIVSSIFSHWSATEQYLGRLLVRVLGADAEPAIAMFSTLTAQHLQLGALEAAAEAALSDDEFDTFRAVLKVTDSVQTPRNHLAHWIWGTCPELPDALLLAEPKTQKERDRELILALEQFDKVGADLGRMAKLNDYDASTVLVYRKADLLRAKRDIVEGSECALLLCFYLDGLFRGRRKIPPGHDPAPLRDQVFLGLSKKRLFHEAWDRIRGTRQNNHQSPPA